jgi:hypothetical protein
MGYLCDNAKAIDVLEEIIVMHPNQVTDFHLAPPNHLHDGCSVRHREREL